MPLADLSFDEAQDVRKRLGEWYVEYGRWALEETGRMLAHALGQRYFWDLPPAERRTIYADYPPVLVDGTVPPSAPGPWQWSIIEAELPELHDRHVQDFAQLLKEEL